jgi:hypothetical protein
MAHLVTRRPSQFGIGRVHLSAAFGIAQYNSFGIASSFGNGIDIHAAGCS